jgi:Membrane domain of glycerophosphoryl diester phosphodiesterase
MCRTLVTSGYSMTEPPVHGFTQREVRVGQAFGRAWKLFSANFWKFFIVTAISDLPVRAYLLWANARPVGEPGPLDGTTMRTIIILLAFVLVLLGQAIVARVAFQMLCRQPAGLHAAVQEALARFFSILGLAILVCLLIFGMITLLSHLPEPALFAMVFMVVASVLFVRWSLALPACVVEGLGVVDSLGRSARLTKSHRWEIFGIIVLVCAPLPAVTAILGAAMSLLGPAFQHLGQFILGVAWITGFNSVLTVVYHDLRVANEGIDSGQIAAVFD